MTNFVFARIHSLLCRMHTGNFLRQEMSLFYINSAVRGYHVYESVWHTTVSDQLGCAREPGNCQETFAVAIIKDEVTVGHVPRSISLYLYSEEV